MGSRETWYRVREDGSILACQENDGPRFLRDGPGAHEFVVTPEQIHSLHSLRAIRRLMREKGLDPGAVDARIRRLEGARP